MPKNLHGGKKHKSSKNKRAVDGEEDNKKILMLPDTSNNQVLAIVRQKLGGSRLGVDCSDGVKRQAIISGKFRKRLWMTIDNILICELETTGKDNECTIIYKYNDSEVNRLRNDGFDWLAFTRNEHDGTMYDDDIIFMDKEQKEDQMDVDTAMNILDEL